MVSNSRMDVGPSGAKGTNASGSGYLSIPEIAGDWNVGVIKTAHLVNKFRFAVSKAVVPDKAGLGFHSARVVTSQFEIFLAKSAHQTEVINMANTGKSIPQVILYTTKNHGTADAMADVAVKITLFNVRFAYVGANLKAQAGGFATQAVNGPENNDPGWGLDTDARVVAQSQDPNNVQFASDYYIVRLDYDAIQGEWSKVEPTGPKAGVVTFYYNSPGNTTVAPA